MTCGSEMELKLSRYVDGELADAERAEVEGHLQECAACRETLGLFRKNDSLLSNSLSRETFGRNLVDTVMESIRREGMPTEAHPVIEDGFWGRLRETPLLPLGVAAALLAAFTAAFGVLLVHQADLRWQVSQIRRGYERTEAAARWQVSRLSGQEREYERIFRDLTVDRAFRGTETGHMVAYMEPDRTLMAKAVFNTKEFTGYHVYRRGENDPAGAFVQLNREPLQIPEFVDRTARGGQGYYYKFRAVRPTGEFTESALIFMRLPAPQDLATERTVRVTCVQVGELKDAALFELERIVDGKTLVCTFHAGPGRRVGGVEDCPGVGPVDFSTDIEIDKIEEGHQTLEINYTEPLLDEQGKLVIDHFENGKPIPATRQTTEILGIRPNLRVTFRAAGAPAGTTVGQVWKGGWILVRARD